MMKEAYTESIFYAAAVLLFVILANVTMMGVLGGLLVRTVATTADVEKEEKSVKHTVDKVDSIWEEFCSIDADEDGKLSHSELCDLVQNDEVCKLLSTTGVDLDAVVNLSGSIFKQYGGALSKSQFTRMLLDMRSKNAARVRDHVETRRFTQAEIYAAISALTNGEEQEEEVSKQSIMTCQWSESQIF